MLKFNLFKWQGSGKVYTLPWLRNRLEYSSDPQRIGEYAKTSFTRSRFVMKMLTEFHLSKNSIVVSEDDHAMWLKRISRAHMPADEAIPLIAHDLMDHVFPTFESHQEQQSFQVTDKLVREIYRIMLDKMLKVNVLKPLDDYIETTKFPHGSRPMVLEGLMYSLRLHMPFMRPVRYFLDCLFFKKSLYMKRVSSKLEQMVYDFSIPRPNSWFSTLVELKESGKITRLQFRGEITSMLVSSFSLASAMGYALLCLAARPQYQRKIQEDPGFAKYFVMEVLRLYPPFRQFGYQQSDVTQGNDKAGGVSHEFMIPIFELHRNSDIWENPKKFYPERFLQPEVAKGFKYMPFGMGKRSCPGRNFSMILLTQALQYVCSDKSPIHIIKRDTLPRGGSGRLLSFAIEDTISYRMK
ncbi:cytochrome P450 [Sphingobacterium anhuiense]|uniref:Cytochrome P450 n=1 Tax=Sphingobacterium anhuiense TaxID=493780 RepID=A0ABW5YQ70_9SPHI